MVLLLAVHTVEAVTAKVPLSIIVLMDHMKRRSIPGELRLRLVLPTSGMQSITLWDSPDILTLQTWLEDSLGADCTTEVSEVQEDFMYGYNMELARIRTAEKVAINSQKTLETVGGKTAQAAEYVGEATVRAISSARQGLEDLDTKTGVITAAKTTTTDALNKVKDVSGKVMQNEAVNNVVQNVGAAAATGWKKVGYGLSWVSEQLVKQNAGAPQEESAASTEGTARLFAEAAGPVPATTTDAVADMPVSTHVATPAPAAT